MKILIGRHDFTELWDGVLYKALSDYPRVSDNEMKDILDFIAYERTNGREVEIEADQPAIRECTACTARGGCMTDLVCHTAPPENAVRILRGGSLLSAVRARGIPAEILMTEPHNAAHDPADFFRYVMFSWGNCQAGDRLVMERRLGRSPSPEEMGPGFIPRIRFYFR